MHHSLAQNRAQNGPFAPNKNFLGKIINIIFIYFLPLSLCEFFKKNLVWIQSYEDAPFLDPK